jgi:hypothetical protein
MNYAEWIEKNAGIPRAATVKGTGAGGMALRWSQEDGKAARVQIAKMRKSLGDGDQFEATMHRNNGMNDIKRGQEAKKMAYGLTGIKPAAAAGVEKVSSAQDYRITAFLEGYEEEMEKVAGMPRALMREGVGGAYGAAKRGLMSEGRAVAKMPGARMAGDVYSRQTMRSVPAGTSMNDHPAAVEAYNKMRAKSTNRAAQTWNLNRAPGENPISFQTENARTDANKSISSALSNFRSSKAGYIQQGNPHAGGIGDAQRRAVKKITDARATRAQGIAEQSVYDAARGQ